MSDKELEEYIKKVEPNFNSHIEKGTIEMSNEYYNLLEERIRRFMDENNQLKEQVECLIKQRDDINKNATEHLEKNIDYTHIAKELRSWLEENLKALNSINIYDRTEHESGEINATENILLKLNELEGKNG